jgi:hypothetical protein
MEETLVKLKAPFPADKLSWRIGQKNKDKTRAMMLVYIDSRDVQDRLDEVCGLNWSDSYSEVKGRLVCSITINGVTRTDGAGDTDFEAEKGGLSDAFKRAAVKWGVGRYLYDAKNYNTWVDCKDMPDYDIYKNNKDYLDKIAGLLSKGVITYKYYLERVKNCTSKEELDSILAEARIKAKEECWSTGNNETFKTNVTKKQKELENETVENSDEK